MWTMHSTCFFFTHIYKGVTYNLFPSSLLQVCLLFIQDLLILFLSVKSSEADQYSCHRLRYFYFGCQLTREASGRRYPDFDHMWCRKIGNRIGGAAAFHRSDTFSHIIRFKRSKHSATATPPIRLPIIHFSENSTEYHMNKIGAPWSGSLPCQLAAIIKITEPVAAILTWIAG